MTSPSYQIPTEVREFAEKSVEQARKAFEGFSGAAQKAIAAVDTSAIPAAAGAKVVGATALGYAEANVKAAFDLATKLVQAKDVQEVLTLQTEFAKSQFAAFQEQTKEMAPPSPRPRAPSKRSNSRRPATTALEFLSEASPSKTFNNGVQDDDRE